MEPSRDDQLAADVRALRPTPHPEFAAALDRRAAAGFPRRSRLPRLSFDRLRALHQRRRLLLPAAALALVAIAVTGAVLATNRPESGSGSGSTLGFLNGSTEQSADPAEEANGTSFEAEAGAVPDAAAASAPTAPATRPGAHRAVERSAEMTLGADPEDVVEDADKVFAAVHANRGIVLQSSIEEGSAGEAGANFELLIPSRRLGDALAIFSAIDEVRSRQETTADITAPTVSTAELLRESSARIDGLLGQLGEAETDTEREAVEAELRQERRHRSRLRSDLRNLRQRANLSGVSLRIETGSAEASSSGGALGIDDALGDAGHVLTVAAAVTLIGLAVLGPIALIALLAWLTYRAWVRRERRRALS